MEVTAEAEQLNSEEMVAEVSTFLSSDYIFIVSVTFYIRCASLTSSDFRLFVVSDT